MSAASTAWDRIHEAVVEAIDKLTPPTWHKPVVSVGPVNPFDPMATTIILRWYVGLPLVNAAIHVEGMRLDYKGGSFAKALERGHLATCKAIAEKGGA
jgi:hypothetical protein